MAYIVEDSPRNEYFMASKEIPTCGAMTVRYVIFLRHYYGGGVYSESIPVGIETDEGVAESLCEWFNKSLEQVEG